MEWIIFAVLLIVACFIQLCLHEASHLLIALWDQGLKPLGFYPYPHFYGGKFYFARYSVEPPVMLDPPHTLRHVGPVIGSAAHVMGLSLIWALTFSCISTAILLPFILCGWIDILWFIRGYFWGSPSCDGKRWRYGDK